MSLLNRVRLTHLGLHRGRPRRWIPKGRHEFILETGTLVFRCEVWSGRFVFISHWVDTMPGVCLSDIKNPWQRKPVMKKRQAKSVMGDANHLAKMETEVLRDHMSLLEHCAVRKYDDSEPREPGWITIKTQGAAWVVQVKDPDGCCSFSAVGETLDKALETASLMLSCDEAPWEPDSFLAQAAARKKKK